MDIFTILAGNTTLYYDEPWEGLDHMGSTDCNVTIAISAWDAINRQRFLYKDNKKAQHATKYELLSDFIGSNFAYVKDRIELT